MKNLIFDFDGVLGNTREAVIYGLVESGREPNKEAAIQNVLTYASKKPHHAKGHTLTDIELEEEYSWLKRFGKIVNNHGFNMFEDFIAEIESLEGAQVAVVSSGSQDYVLPAIEKTNLNPTHILAFEDHHSKEDKIETICRDWGVDTTEVYYFTDTLADVYELRDLIAPDKLIAVAWGYCTKEQLLAELPQKNFLYEPADIRKLF